MFINCCFAMVPWPWVVPPITSCEALPIDVTGMMFVRPQLSAPMKLKMNASTMARIVWPTLRFH